jgi:hypothetical protein
MAEYVDLLTNHIPQWATWHRLAEVRPPKTSSSPAQLVEPAQESFPNCVVNSVDVAEDVAEAGLVVESQSRSDEINGSDVQEGGSSKEGACIGDGTLQHAPADCVASVEEPQVGSTSDSPSDDQPCIGAPAAEPTGSTEQSHLADPYVLPKETRSQPPDALPPKRVSPKDSASVREFPGAGGSWRPWPSMMRPYVVLTNLMMMAVLSSMLLLDSRHHDPKAFLLLSCSVSFSFFALLRVHEKERAHAFEQIRITEVTRAGIVGRLSSHICGLEEAERAQAERFLDARIQVATLQAEVAVLRAMLRQRDGRVQCYEMAC